MHLEYRLHQSQSILHHLDRLGTDQRCRLCRHRRCQRYLDLCLVHILGRWLIHHHQGRRCRRHRWLD